MKFHEIKSDEINLITAYSDSSVSIGNKIITQSSVIFPETLIQNILIDEIDDLKQKKINEIFQMFESSFNAYDGLPKKSRMLILLVDDFDDGKVHPNLLLKD